MCKACAVIVAGGKGKRINAGINKQFLEINGKPIIYYTLKAFEIHEDIKSIVLVAAPEEVEYCKREIVQKYEFSKVTRIVSGGAERRDSVFNGLKAVENSEIVVIHDGARPFVNSNAITQGIKFASLYGASSCSVSPKDTIKVRDENGFSKETLNRNTLACLQTPQCFKYDIIYKCHEKVQELENNFTDDTSVVEYFQHRVYLYPGDYRNIKITTPEDLLIAKSLLEGN
jgi:2-C-methyl-D-erythritol 4-phosphate cytidylyltransferase